MVAHIDWRNFTKRQKQKALQIKADRFAKMEPLINDARAFLLLKFIPADILASMGEEVLWKDKWKEFAIPGIPRRGLGKETEIIRKRSAYDVEELHDDIGAIDHHFLLYAGTLGVRRFLNLRDLFHLHRRALMKAWTSNIDTDIYGKEDLRKVLPAVSKTINAAFTYGNDELSEVFKYVFLKTPMELRRNDGRHFEKKVKSALELTGWRVRETPITGDFGGDLIAERDGIQYCLQCKDVAKPAGVRAVQEALAAAQFYVCDYAAVICEAGFTEQSVTLASRLGVLLINEGEISRLGELRLLGVSQRMVE